MSSSAQPSCVLRNVEMGLRSLCLDWVENVPHWVRNLFFLIYKPKAVVMEIIQLQEARLLFENMQPSFVKGCTSWESPQGL